MQRISSRSARRARRISKGKAGCPAELGVPICIIEDRHGRILHAIAMREGTGKDCAVRPVEEAQERFPGLRVASFDRGFRGPENRIELDKWLGRDPMPRKGKPAVAERARRSDPLLRKMASRRSGIESRIAISSGEAWTGRCRMEPTASSAWSICQRSP